MATAENSSKGRNVTPLIIASILTLVTGFSSLAHAQEETQGASAGIQDLRLGENPHHLSSPIEGSWIFDIDVPGQGPNFHSLTSFTASGVVITSASLPGPSNSPYSGSWRQTGANRFRAAFYAFLPDASGVGVALSKVSLNVQLTSRNTLTGTAAGASCDLQGENCVQTVELQNTGREFFRNNLAREECLPTREDQAWLGRSRTSAGAYGPCRLSTISEIVYRLTRNTETDYG